MTPKIVGLRDNLKIILVRGGIMHQRQEIQIIAEELMNITEGIMAFGKEILPIRQCVESVAK